MILCYMYEYIYHILISIHSIDMLSCNLTTSVTNMVKAIKHVIQRARTTVRRSVLAMPVITPELYALNYIANEAVEENIVVVTAAGKNKYI